VRLFRSILALMLVASAVPAAVLGWILATQSGHQALDGQLLRSTLLAVLLALALAVALSAWFARRLARPVAECVRGALEIGRGRFGHQVAVTVRNEIGELAYTFIAALEAGYLATLRSLASAIDAKDASTHGHSQRVAELSIAIGRELGLDDARLKPLAYGGLLHDVGKIGVPEAILHKAARLGEDEMEQMRAHPAIGAEILRGVDFLRDALAAVRNHHERWDGSGYPDRLAGDAIPLVARIVNAADTFDACTSPRPYQSAMSIEDAVAVLLRLRGTQIDPAVCDALVRVVRRDSGAESPPGTLAAVASAAGARAK
jgi:putative nucleotidyltransferase with HDIG domain